MVVVELFLQFLIQIKNTYNAEVKAKKKYYVMIPASFSPMMLYSCYECLPVFNVTSCCSLKSQQC